MAKCSVIQIDAFTQEPGKGNPAGVVLAGDSYTEEEMQQLAKKVGFNETVFICSSQIATYRLRYFTPGYETPLCGHATVGAIFALYQGKGSQEIVIETGAGLLPIHYSEETQSVTMSQAEPQFIDFQGDRGELCRSLGIASDDLHPRWPIQYGNTGSWTLIVPLNNPKSLDKMVPMSAAFPEILKELPRSSIHPFAPVSVEEGIYYGRHFSSPYAETEEDSVTGTASGVMGAYLLNHEYHEEEKQLIIYQGKHVEREGRIDVRVKRGQHGDHQVSITGTACFNQVLELELD